MLTRREWVLQMRTSALFGTKNTGVFEIYGVSTRTRGKGVNFSRFCADVLFYGRSLIKKLVKWKKEKDWLEKASIESRPRLK